MLPPAMTPLLPNPAPFQVVLVNPQIPPNTGNTGRTCAVTGSRLHLVGPFGFSLEESALRRAGLDYWDDLRPEIYSGWPDFEERTLQGRGDRLHLFTTRAERSLFEVRFQPEDFLVFGQEQLGLPPALLALYPGREVAIPMLAGQRSLNLAVAAGIGLYQAIRSLST
jgi:tRNA (cytidine/uridine-2'-O-)-methyltransferase